MELYSYWNLMLFTRTWSKLVQVGVVTQEQMQEAEARVAEYFGERWTTTILSRNDVAAYILSKSWLATTV